MARREKTIWVVDCVKLGREEIALDRPPFPGELGQRIFDHMLETASGRRTVSEDLGYGDNEFVPWQVGAVM